MKFNGVTFLMSEIYSIPKFEETLHNSGDIQCKVGNFLPKLVGKLIRKIQHVPQSVSFPESPTTSGAQLTVCDNQ